MNILDMRRLSPMYVLEEAGRWHDLLGLEDLEYGTIGGAAKAYL